MICRLGYAQESLRETSSFNKLHGEEGLSVVIAHVEDLDDVRVLEAGDRFGFPQEASSRLWTGMDTGEQHLDSDGAVEPHVPCPVDDPHTAAAQHLEEFVPRDLGEIDRGCGCVVERCVGHWRREHGIQLSVASEFSLPALADVRQQFGMIAAYVFRGSL